MPRSVPPKGMRIFQRRRKYCPRGATAKNPRKIAVATATRLNLTVRCRVARRVLSERRFFYRANRCAARSKLEAIERTIASRRCIGTCPAGHGVERGGWNGPRKHGEGGNTPAERGSTRRGEAGGKRGLLEGDYGFLYALGSVCANTYTRAIVFVRVYARECRGGLRARERARTRARRVEGYLL